MHTSALQLVLLLLGASVLSIVFFRKLGLPPILGYLLVGAVIGPHALGLFQGEELTASFAEFGVVLLMFTIGLEFSLPRLMTMRHIVFGLGLLQVALTTSATMLIVALFGINWVAGLALGGVLTMSSTAILSKLLSERVELDSPHGKQVIGVLLFQDLAVVPFLVIIPSLHDSSMEDIATRLILDAVKALLLLGAVLFIGQRWMGKWMGIVARKKSDELFMLNVLLITLGLAAITQLSGLSLALGAFIAGMLISETEYRYQVEEDIKPFRDLLLGLFFISIGITLNYGVILESWHKVLMILVTLLLVKLLITTGISRLLGSNPGTSLRTGLWLCTGGEFGLVLLAEAMRVELMPEPLLQTVLAALVLSLVLAPIIVFFSDHLVFRFVPSEWLLRATQLTSLASNTVRRDHHIIICGYGRTGQYLAETFNQESVSWIALENDAENVLHAANEGVPVLFGDSGKREILMAAGLARASVVIISFSDTHSSLRVLANLRNTRADVPVVARAKNQEDSELLLTNGATEVVPEALESSIMLASNTLALLGLPLSQVVQRQRKKHEEQYRLLRGFFHLASTSGSSDSESLMLQTFTLKESDMAVGKSLEELQLEHLGVSVSTVCRPQLPELPIKPTLVLQADDMVIVQGTPANLDAVRDLLLGKPVGTEAT